MCLILFRHDPGRPIALRALDTRDAGVYRLHGRAALAAVSARRRAFDYHWRASRAPLSVHDAQALAAARVAGPIDQSGGTWLALGTRHRVYARLLTASPPYSSSGRTYGRARDDWGSRESASRAYVAVDLAAYPSAAEAACRYPEALVDMLERGRLSMPPLHALVADPYSAHLVSLDDRGIVSVSAVAAGRLAVVSVHGLDQPRPSIAPRLIDILNHEELPQWSRESWDRWVGAGATARAFSDTHATAGAVPYRAQEWRAFTTSLFQPPYLSAFGDPWHHTRPTDRPTRGDVEWTTSSACVALGAERVEIYYFERDALAPNASIPDSLAAMPRTPEGSRDYYRVDV